MPWGGGITGFGASRRNVNAKGVGTICFGQFHHILGSVACNFKGWKGDDAIVGVVGGSEIKYI